MPFDVVSRNLDVLVSGIILTIVISVASIAAGLVLGVGVAAGRLSRVRLLHLVSTTYVELIRNTPLLVQLFLLYFGLPELGLRPSAVQAAIVALSVNNGAYLGEIIRGGLQSVSRGQIEAAAAIGLSQRTTYFEILLPLGLRSVVPAITNQFILTILATSIASVVGTPELTQQVLFIDSRVFRTIELLIFLTAAYAVMTFTVSAISSLINRRLDRAFAQ
jgi:His/Glu/Gln/Arg/opine family amino acid ABC transporter permease subunit